LWALCALVSVTNAIQAIVWTTGSGCTGATSFNISNVVNQACFSLHFTSPGSSFQLTSGDLTCASLTTGSSWSANVYVILGGGGGDYTCSGSGSFKITISGTGLTCTAIKYLGSTFGHGIIDCGVNEGNTIVSAGGVEAQVESALPFGINVAPTGQIENGNYLRMSYSYLGEVKGSGATATIISNGGNIFHSIPLTDIVVTEELGAYASDADARFAFVGYLGPISQYYPVAVASAFGVNINFLAKESFGISTYPIQFPGTSGTTNVCLRGTGSSCTALQVDPGTIKNAVGLYNWTYSTQANSWRIQYSFTVVGWTRTSVYFNNDPTALPGAFTGQVTSVTYVTTGNNNFTYNVQQSYNMGDNTFGTAVVTAAGTAGSLTLNVDIPLAGLSTSGWWLYDPDVIVNDIGGVSDASGGGGSSSATTVSPSLLVAVCGLLALLRA